MFNFDLVNFQCTLCSQRLELKKEELLCHNCKNSYSIVKDVPRFVSSSNYADSFGFQWNIFKKTQLDSFIGKNISRERIYRVTGFDRKTNLKKYKLLEAGSGAGRFTEILGETKAEIHTFDFSSAIDANKENNNNFKNINFFQADVLNIPFPDNYFDYVLCLGVIQHTENPYEAFVSLSRKLKPGGRIFLDVYSKRWHTYLWSKYLLRPITTRIPKELLFNIILKLTPYLIPLTRLLKFIFGKLGMRISPIVEYSDIGLSKKHNKEWAILDTFDMYSPQYDIPQSITNVREWFKKNNFVEISVTYGPNGIIGSGIKK